MCWTHRNTYAYHQQCWIKIKRLCYYITRPEKRFWQSKSSSLIETLKLHHIPDEVITLISSLYSDCDISILTDSFMTSSIRVHRCVLQSDTLSPLLFNLIINTLINTIKSERIECTGYFHQNCLGPKHWFQFADDTAIVTALASDNQHLCDVFLKWTSWADLTIKVSQCHTIGIRKNKTASEQLQPYITICKQRIPSFEQDKQDFYLLRKRLQL